MTSTGFGSSPRRSGLPFACRAVTNACSHALSMSVRFGAAIFTRSHGRTTVVGLPQPAFSRLRPAICGSVRGRTTVIPYRAADVARVDCAEFDPAPRLLDRQEARRRCTFSILVTLGGLPTLEPRVGRAGGRSPLGSPGA
jgi:hypothetical protein